MIPKKLPSFSQWKQIFKILNRAEKTILIALTVLASGSIVYLAANFYINHTIVTPAYGGSYTEGVVGQPRFINPIYGETNDVDRTLIDLIYSGLMTYDQDGNLTTDLIESYNISGNGAVYSFDIKNNVYWQDGTQLTVDDVIYTIKTIQNSDYKSPLRANWLNVQTQKTSDYSFTLSLGSSYNSFLENLTIKILPQHIWKNILPENFVLSPYNLKPIGSGLYVLKSIDQTSSGFIKKLTLSANHKYYNKIPYISELNFRFFDNKDDLTTAINQGQISGFSVSSLGGDESAAEKEIRQGWLSGEKFNVYSFSLPRYFAVFFNTDKNHIFSDKNVAQAFNYATDKENLVDDIKISGKEDISIVSSPILPNYFNYNGPTTIYGFDQDTAGDLLDKSGYKTQEGNIRAKENTKKPAFQFTHYLSSKSTGSEVAELQSCLSKIGDDFKALLEGETSGKYGTGTEAAVTAFQKQYLPNVPSTGETGPGTRKELNKLCWPEQENLIPLQITITTINQPQLVKTAEILKDEWEQIGATIFINAIELPELKDIIKNRDYDALLYGQALGSLPDLYPFWHSTQITSPGLNLSIYQNKSVDQLLKEARETLNPQIKAQDYEKIQDIIINDAPAVFLYNPSYLYWASDKIAGIDTTKIVDPAKRFSNIENWYVKTHRVAK